LKKLPQPPKACFWLAATKGYVVFFSNILYFHPEPGEMIQFDKHIVQLGWFNHQKGKSKQQINFFIAQALIFFIHSNISQTG